MPAIHAPPSAPQRFKARGRDAGNSLSWSAPKSSGTAAITNYQIYRGTASGAESLLATIGNTTIYNDDSAVAGVKYFYYVRAVNSVGAGAASNEDSALWKP